jgi:hypothetical protein
MIHLSPTPPPLTTLYGPFQPAPTSSVPQSFFDRLSLVVLHLSSAPPFSLNILFVIISTCLPSLPYSDFLCFCSLSLPYSDFLCFCSLSLPYSDFLSSFCPFLLFLLLLSRLSSAFLLLKKGRRNGKEKAVLWIRILMFLGLLDPDPSFIKQKK